MGRLKPYNGEFKTISELDEIVNRVCHRLNHEKSQGSNRRPIELWAAKKSISGLSIRISLDIFTASKLEKYHEIQ